TQTNNWASGIQLQQDNKASNPIHKWSWHGFKNIQLTWHGFLGQDKLTVSAKSESLAMNGYFLLEPVKNKDFLPERWLVNRFGRIRVLRKHVA
ncbi:MAG: hypothetical protein QNK11_01355, partial [Legionella sp.]|nr:hypothetical protein [Legionella sp.]